MRFLALSALTLTLTASASTIGITDLCNTGVTSCATGSASATLLPTTGLTDPNWVITAGIGIGSTLTYHNGSWSADGPDSRWIGPASQPALGGVSTYSTRFTVSGTPSLASISGRYWSDNELMMVLLNSNLVTVPLSGPTDFSGAGTGFSIVHGISTPFLSGANTLEFVVRNRGAGGDPLSPTDTGLRVEFNGVPEPSTYAMALIGLGLTVWGTRRRRA